MRIVSLLPSATEIICALGLRDSLVGVSHECDFPGDVGALPRVTTSAIDKDLSSAAIDQQVRDYLETSDALYVLDLDLLAELQPDLIVTQALCDVCAVSAVDVEAAICRLPTAPAIVNLEPVSLADLYQTIERVADAAGQPDAARTLIANLISRVERVATACANVSDRPRTACLEWIDPPFNAGHWTPELVSLAGGISVTGEAHQPSRTIDWEAIVKADPEIVFVACCGYSLERTLEDLPMLQQGPASIDPEFWANRQVFVTDGNQYFNRPGPRLVDSLEILADALHPQLNLLDPALPKASSVVLRTSRNEKSGLSLRHG